MCKRLVHLYTNECRCGTRNCIGKKPAEQILAQSHQPVRALTSAQMNTTIHAVYRVLPQQGKKDCGSVLSSDGHVEEALKVWIPKAASLDAVVEKNVKNKALRLDNYASPQDVQKRAEREAGKKKKNVLSRSQLKQHGLLDIKQDGLRYNFEGLALHHLWLQYISSVLPPGPPLARCHVLAVSDLHGALLTVFQSRNPCHINISGFVVEETERTFVLLSEDDCLRVLPKPDCVFYLPVRDTLHVIHGQNFCHRAAHRSKMKVKAKDCIMLS